jgi:hypothetical protein
MYGNVLEHASALTVGLTKIPYSAAPGYWTKDQYL